MQTAYIRNIFHIHRTKEIRIILFLLFLICSKFIFAQRNTYGNLPDYDDKKLHYGFLMGLNSSGYKIKHSEEFLQSDSIGNIYPEFGTGFNLGFVINYRLSNYSDLRLLPGVAFYNNVIKYDFKNSDGSLLALFELSIIEAPLLFKYKSERRGNNRLYMIGGIKPAIRVGARKGDRNLREEEQISLQRFNLSIEYGIGLDHYFPLFKFSPEIRFSYGILDIYDRTEYLYSRQIKSLTSFTTTFVIIFE